MRQRNRLAGIALILLVSTATACGESGGNEPETSADGNEAPGYPHDTLEIIVPFGAGGGVDTLARGMAQYLPKYLDGVDVVVENRDGGGSREGSARFEREGEPDGTKYVFIVEASTVGSQVLLGGEYDPTSWEPIAAVSDDKLLIAVAEDSSIQSIEDFVAAAEDEPLTYASSGAGSVLHAQGVIVGEELGLNLKHVPFDGSAQEARAVVGGDVDAMVAQVQNVLQHDGLRALAIVGDEADPRLPDVPTMTDEGYDVTALTSTRGWLAPTGTSDEILTALESATQAVHDDPEFQAWAEDAGYALHFYDREAWGERVDGYAERIIQFRDLIVNDMD